MIWFICITNLTPGLSKPEIAELYGISTSSIYRVYYENKSHVTMSAQPNVHPFLFTFAMKITDNF
jgi:hypothetical protein